MEQAHDTLRLLRESAGDVVSGMMIQQMKEEKDGRKV